MKISIPSYDGGYKVVSIAADQPTLEDLISENVRCWHINGSSIVEYPDCSFVSDNPEVIKKISSCNNYDVFEVGKDGTAFRCYDDSSSENLFFITGKCNSNCIMCPSPEHMRRNGEDADIDALIEIAGHIPANTPHLTITGGEPFLAGRNLFRLLDFCKYKFTGTKFLILTNGRAFAVDDYCRLLEKTIPANCTLGIPIHGSTPETHDAITQSTGSFGQTMTGLKRLQRIGITLELRIVVCRNNLEELVKIARLITRELRGTDRVCIMAMEMTGSAYMNRHQVWVPYRKSFPYVKQAIHELTGAGINVMLFNYPLCTVEKKYWTLCARSISGYKVRYTSCCEDCAVKDSCGGVFAGSLQLEEADLCPINL